MENRKIRVAITQGDANGVGFELIFKTFMETEMLELCTPIIYGSPKVASYHSKALNLHCQFSIINRVEDAREDRLNLLVCYEDDVKVEFGRHTLSSALIAARSVKAAMSDFEKGGIDVLVCGPIDDRKVQLSPTEEVSLEEYISNLVDKDNHSLKLYENDVVRMAVVSSGDIKRVANAITKESISSTVRSLCATLKRDYRIDNPRIAVLALNLKDCPEENEILLPTTKALLDEGMQVFGPYKSDRFFAGRGYEAFDVVLAMHYEQAMLPMRMLTDGPTAVVQTSLPIVCTMPHCDAQMAIAGRGKADAALLRKAIYSGIDIFRARKDYDEALANPLEKRYKERSDSGERPYFAPIKKEEPDGQL